MEIKKYYNNLSKNTFEYFNNKKEKLYQVALYLVDRKTDVICTENPTEYIVIIYIGGKFFITDRIINPESNYILSFKTEKNQISYMKITDNDDICYFEIDFKKQTTKGEKLNILNIVELFECIFQCLKVEEITNKH